MPSNKQGRKCTRETHAGLTAWLRVHLTSVLLPSLVSPSVSAVAIATAAGIPATKIMPLALGSPGGFVASCSWRWSWEGKGEPEAAGSAYAMEHGERSRRPPRRRQQLVEGFLPWFGVVRLNGNIPSSSRWFHQLRTVRVCDIKISQSFPVFHSSQRLKHGVVVLQSSSGLHPNSQLDLIDLGFHLPYWYVCLLYLEVFLILLSWTDPIRNGSLLCQPTNEISQGSSKLGCHNCVP